MPRPALPLAVLISCSVLTAFADEPIMPGNIVLVRAAIPTCTAFPGILEMHRVLEDDQGMTIGSLGPVSVLGRTENQLQTDLSNAIAKLQGRRPKSLRVEVLRSEPDTALWKEFAVGLLVLRSCTRREHHTPVEIYWEGPMASGPPNTRVELTAQNSVASLPAFWVPSLRSAAAHPQR